MRTEEDKSEPSTGANNDYFGSAGEVPIAKSMESKQKLIWGFISETVCHIETKLGVWYTKTWDYLQCFWRYAT